MQTDRQPNVWRTIVIVAVCMIAGVFMWQFLTRASSDVQAFFLGIFVFGGPAGVAVGWLACLWHLHAPQSREEIEAAYARGHDDGRRAGWCAAIAEDPVVEVIVPARQQQSASVVPVRR